MSSSFEICYVCGSAMGLYVSKGMFLSWNIFSLKSLKFSSGSSTFSLTLLFRSPQNCLGLYFIISGNVNYIYALACLHYYPNFFSASCVCACTFPFFWAAALYLFLAVLHRSLNHGAMCFAHLFGFRAIRFFVALKTPALVASSIMNSSTLAARISLSASYFYVIASNASLNSFVDVCSFHVIALEL